VITVAQWQPDYQIHVPIVEIPSDAEVRRVSTEKLQNVKKRYYTNTGGARSLLAL